jgi:hypothetical protein
LYQRTKFKSDPDNYESHRLNLLKGIKFTFVKEDNNKASFDTNLEAYIQFKGCRNITVFESPRTMMFMDGENTGDFKVKYMC